MEETCVHSLGTLCGNRGGQSGKGARLSLSSVVTLQSDTTTPVLRTYEAHPESKDTKVLNMYNIFNLQKRL
jgi:hypothetical protein